MVADMADDPLEPFAEELGRHVEREFRAEARELERQAARLESRRRDMTDLAAELAARGDIVTAVAGSHTATGPLAYARGTLAGIETPDGVVDINLIGPAVLRIDERRAHGGRSSAPGASSLRSRLLEFELEGKRLRIWAPRLLNEVDGTVSAVGQDHAVITDLDHVEWVLRFDEVAFVQAI